MLDWIRRQPVIAARIFDVAVITAGVALHRYGIEIPAELKLAMDGLLLALLGGATAATWQSVSPVSK